MLEINFKMYIINSLKHNISGPDYMERASTVERAETQPSVRYYIIWASPAQLQS